MEIKNNHPTNRYNALNQTFVQMNFAAADNNRPASAYPILQKYRNTAE